MELAHPTGDDLVIGLALIAKSVAEAEHADSLDASVRAAQHLRRAGSESKLAALLSTTGYMGILEGDHDLAERALADALEAAKAAEDREATAYACGNLGLLRLTQDRCDEAAAAFGREIEIWREGRFPKRLLLAEGLFGLAAVAAARGAHETAARLLGASEGPAPEPIMDFEHAFWSELERRFLDPARAALGEEAWERALAAGRALATADAIAEGLSEAAPG